MPVSSAVASHRFTDPASRLIYPEEDHPTHGRVYTAQLRRVVTQQGPRSPAATLADTLREQSAEFAALWSDHEIGVGYTSQKRLRNTEVGLMDLHCQTLLDPDQAQSLLVFTATPGTESYQKLQLEGGQGRVQSGRPLHFILMRHASPPSFAWLAAGGTPPAGRWAGVMKPDS